MIPVSALNQIPGDIHIDLNVVLCTKYIFLFDMMLIVSVFLGVQVVFLVRYYQDYF